MFNAFNRANFAPPASAIGNAQAGQISATAPPAFNRRSEVHLLIGNDS
jgi:hypothetical protein